LRDLAACLAAAKFGVAIWSAGAIGTLSVEMLCGLIDDLDRTTRFAGLPLPPGNEAATVLQAMAWETGLPPRTGFAGGAPQHDPWRFDAERLIASGEADVALWISAFSPGGPPWQDAAPTIALVPPGTHLPRPASVTIEIGRPGIDHDAMLADPSLGSLVFVRAPSPRPLPRLADVIGAIVAALPPC
jgi:formylmethanofuran dehydrogenase subunit B